MNAEIESYNAAQATAAERQICDVLAKTIDKLLPAAESKI